MKKRMELDEAVKKLEKSCVDRGIKPDMIIVSAKIMNEFVKKKGFRRSLASLTDKSLETTLTGFYKGFLVGMDDNLKPDEMIMTGQVKS